jgi:hypothetical protein
MYTLGACCCYSLKDSSQSADQVNTTVRVLLGGRTTNHRGPTPSATQEAESIDTRRSLDPCSTRLETTYTGCYLSPLCMHARLLYAAPSHVALPLVCGTISSIVGLRGPEGIMEEDTGSAQRGAVALKALGAQGRDELRVCHVADSETVC